MLKSVVAVADRLKIEVASTPSNESMAQVKQGCKRFMGRGFVVSLCLLSGSMNVWVCVTSKEDEEADP